MVDYAALARMRPLMPLQVLAEIMGPAWTPPAEDAAGRVFLSGVPEFSAQIDEAGLLGRVSFYRDFPADLVVEGLHTGMALDAARQLHPGMAASAGKARPASRSLRRPCRTATRSTCASRTTACWASICCGRAPSIPSRTPNRPGRATPRRTTSPSCRTGPTGKPPLRQSGRRRTGGLLLVVPVGPGDGCRPGGRPAGGAASSRHTGAAVR